MPLPPHRRESLTRSRGQSASPDVAYPEVALNQKVNQKVKNLIQKLGEAIHESVSESENIAGVVKNIREQGFDVLLMLEATIGLNELEMEDATGSGESSAESTGDAALEGPFTTHDLTFLKSLRISVSDDSEASDDPDISDEPEDTSPAD